MNLNTEKWIDFQIEKLFNVEAGKYYYSDEYSEGDTPYCSASAENNGVAKKIDLLADFEGNKIITGKVGCTTFYEPMPFCATSDVNVLTAKFDMTPAIGLFIATVINKNENYRWNYGRQCRVGNTKKITIKLPAVMHSDGCYVIDQDRKYSKHGYIPDFAFMEEYIRSLRSKAISTTQSVQSIHYDYKEWKSFTFGRLIDNKNIYKSKSYNKSELETSDISKDGFIHFVSRTEENNSIDCYAMGSDFSEIEKGNAITIGDTTSTVAYQSAPFVNGDHIIVIRADWLNKYTGLFIVSLLRKERYRYSYGRAFLMDSIKNTKLLLPVKKKNGKPIIDEQHTFSDEGYIPDWQWMENFIKELPYSDRI